MRKLTLFVGLAAALLVTAAVVRAAQLYNFWFPVDAVLTNPCNGEDVAFTGKFHSTFNVTVNGNTFHIEAHDNAAQISGTGLSTGAKYTGSQADNFTLNLAKGEIDTEEGMFRMNGQGGVPNFTVHYLLHITVNANGDLTAFVDHYTIKGC
jgi:hypothetical protein